MPCAGIGARFAIDHRCFAVDFDEAVDSSVWIAVLAEGDHEAVIGLGPAAPREFEQTIATPAVLEPLIAPLRGGIVRLEDGLPVLRNVREGRPAAGRGWIGLTPRAAYETRSVTQSPLLPAWLVLLAAAGLIVTGWLREGRR